MADHESDGVDSPDVQDIPVGSTEYKVQSTKENNRLRRAAGEVQRIFRVKLKAQSY